MSKTVVVVTEWRGEFDHVVCEADCLKEGIEIAIGNMRKIAKRNVDYPVIRPDFLPIALYLVDEGDNDSITVWKNQVYVKDKPVPVHQMLVKRVIYSPTDSLE